MESIKNKVSEQEHCSFKNAHLLNEFAKVLQTIGNDIENSVSLFDKVGEKNEIFRNLENSLNSPLNSMIHMDEITTNCIYDMVYESFVKTFLSKKEKYNYIHFVKNNTRDITFFVSPKDSETKEQLYRTDFEYATGDLSKFINVHFCMLESDMEKELSNTTKIDFENA